MRRVRDGRDGRRWWGVALLLFLLWYDWDLLDCNLNNIRRGRELERGV